MSTRKGNPSHGPPAHQNKFAFKHNKNSRKTEKIISYPIECVCSKCRAKLEWRKKYRKYKPLTTPSKCKKCLEKRVTNAYHNICKICHRELHLCAMCMRPDSETKDETVNEEEIGEGNELEMEEDE